MHIEVTEKTFNAIFKDKRMEETEQKETHTVHHFYNSKLEQRGKSIYNYSSHVWQYYLTDINS